MSEMYNAIFKRKSFHLFRNTGDDKLTDEEIENIYSAWKEFTPLYDGIRTDIQIVSRDTTLTKRDADYCILIYSEKKDNYLVNAGYLGQQLDLWLVANNIGTLWYGIGKPKERQYDGMDFVIMICIKKINDQAKYRKDMFRSKRKEISEIWEGEILDGVTDIVRFAPSACNLQPWKCVNENKIISVYRYRNASKRGIMPKNMVIFYNQIDIGIFLCFLDLCLEHEKIPFSKILFTDTGDFSENTLVAKYKILELNNVK